METRFLRNGTGFPFVSPVPSPFGDAFIIKDTHPLQPIAIRIQWLRNRTNAKFWPLYCDIALPRSSSVAPGFMVCELGASLGSWMTS